MSYSQSDEAKEVLRGFEDLFAQDGRKVFLNYMITFHGGRVEGRMRELAMCAPFFFTRKQRHALPYPSQRDSNTRLPA